MTGSSLLAELSASAVAEIRRLGSRHRYDAGTTLLREGDGGSDVLFLLSGCAKVVVVTPDGRETLLAIRGCGDAVGELAAIDGGRRSATVVTAVPTEVRRLSGEQFLEVLRRHPDDWLAVSRYVSSKLRDASRHRAGSGIPLPARLARILLELRGSFGRPVPEGVLIDLPLPQSALAALAGASQPSLHRALTELRRAGLVDTGYRRIVILDEAGLELARKT